MNIQDLSDKQKKILSLASQGQSSIEIGRQIHRSPKTVRNTLSVIYQKLGVANRVQAAVLMTNSENRDSSP